MHILVDAANVTGRGARALGLSLLPAFQRVSLSSQFTFLLPDEPGFRSLALANNSKAIFFKILRGGANDRNRIKYLFWDLPRLVHRLKPDICLTLGDIGSVCLSCPQVIFLHNPYLLYAQAEIGKTWPLLKRVYLTQHLAYSLRHVARVIVQSCVMADRLAKRYKLDPKRIVEILQPVPEHIVQHINESSMYPQIATCPKPIRLLFLAAYHPHKNHAILPSVAGVLRRRNLSQQVQIFLTLDDSQISSGEIKRILSDYPDVITNLGHLPRGQVASALRASTALFLPTLAESYGLVYLEALACGIPILTSDRDFARWMCQNLAHYFEPLDASSIVDAIEKCHDLKEKSDYSSRAAERLRDFPKDWDEVARSFVGILQGPHP